MESLWKLSPKTLSEGLSERQSPVKRLTQTKNIHLVALEFGQSKNSNEL